MTNERVLEICKSSKILSIVTQRNEKFVAHQVRMPDWSYAKQLTFSANKATLGGNRQKTVYERILGARNIKIAKNGKKRY